jgi:hypothetical protein
VYSRWKRVGRQETEGKEEDNERHRQVCISF